MDLDGGELEDQDASLDDAWADTAPPREARPEAVAAASAASAPVEDAPPVLANEQGAQLLYQGPGEDAGPAVLAGAGPGGGAGLEGGSASSTTTSAAPAALGRPAASAEEPPPAAPFRFPAGSAKPGAW